MGFEDRDLAVRERGFRIQGERLTHVCSVPVELIDSDAVFIALVDEANGDAVVWRASRSGKLVATARFASGQAARINNADAATLFVAEKEYLSRQLQSQTLAPPARNLSPPWAIPAQDEAEHTPKSESPAEPLSSELFVVLVNPWIIPGIAVILGLAMFKRRHREQ